MRNNLNSERNWKKFKEPFKVQIWTGLVVLID